MFGPDEFAALFVVVLGYALFLFRAKRIRKGKSKAEAFFKQDNTPLEIQQSSLYGSEQHISCTCPIPLNGTYDQLYERLDNALIVADTKTRNKPQVFHSDVIQLSAYKVILENSKEFKGKQVLDYGYMRLVCKGVTHYKKVDLMREDQVVELYQRRRAILNGSQQATKADSRGKCLNCHQLKLCGGVKSFRRTHTAAQGIKRKVSEW